jgi:ribosomal protein L24E
LKIFLSLPTTPRKAKWTEIFRISPLFPTTPRKPE